MKWHVEIQAEWSEGLRDSFYIVEGMTAEQVFLWALDQRTPNVDTEILIEQRP